MKRNLHKEPIHDFSGNGVWCRRCGSTIQQADLGQPCVTDADIEKRETAAHLGRVVGRLRRQADR